MNDNGTKIGGLFYDIDAPNDKLNKSLDESDKKVKEFGDNAGDTGEKVRSSFNKAAIGLAAVGATFTVMSKQALDFTKTRVADAKSLAREIGTTATEASKLTAAFGRMGVSADQARTSFGIFSKNIVAASENVDSNRLATDKLKLQMEATKREIVETTAEIKKHGDKSGDLNLKLRALNNTLATQGNELKKSVDGFSKLGISTKDASGRQKDFNTILLEVADKFKELPDGVDKTALSMELFGRSGKDMIKILNLGGEGITELEKKAESLGLTLNEKTIANIDALNKSQKELKDQTDSLKIAIGTATAPILTEFNKQLNNVLTSLLTTDGPVKELTANVIAFGGPIASASAGVVAFGANLAQLWPIITKVTAALVSMTAVSIVGWSALAVAAIGSITFAVYELDKAFDKIKKGFEDLGKKRVNVNTNSDMQVSGTSGIGLVQQLRNAFSGFAQGTNYAPGGLSWVGEKGPELRYIPRGTQIIPADVSQAMVSKSTNPEPSRITNVHIGTVNDRSDADYILRRISMGQERVARGISPA